MLQVRLVRHGESEAQLAHRLGRSAEVALTAEGRRQADRLGRHHAADFRAAAAAGCVVSSDAVRAVETATIALEVADASLDPLPKYENLTEIWRGEFDGVSCVGEMLQKWKAYCAERTAENYMTLKPCEDAESLAEVTARAVACLDDLASRAPPEGAAPVLWVFCHSVVIRCLLWHVLACNPENELNISNTAVSTLVRRSASDPWRVTNINDTSHMAEKASAA